MNWKVVDDKTKNDLQNTKILECIYLASLKKYFLSRFTER